MKTKIFLLLFSASFLFAQSSNINIKQITNVEGDAVNPCIPFNPYLRYQPKIFFELHKGNTSNIYAVEVYSDPDSISDPIQITNDSLSVNPVYYVGDYDSKSFLFFQTKRNGNWDIAYKEFENDVWSETKFAAETLEDETNPKLFFYGYYSRYYPYDTLRILYCKNNSIYAVTFNDSSKYTEKVFSGSDSVLYSQPTGITYRYFYSSYNYKLFIDIASKKIINNNSFIVHKKKNLTDNIWEKEIIVDSGDCNNPQFLDIQYQTSLTYEKKMNNFYNIQILSEWDSTNSGQTLKDSLKGDLSNLKTTNVYLIIDKKLKKRKDADINQPYSYKYFFNDSMFIGLRKNFYSYYPFDYGDTLIQTKVVNSNLTVGIVGNYAEIYTVWEDSVNGNTQLFGNKFFYIIGAVNEPEIPNNFYLYQNYPNPFNPTTKIEFYLIHGSFTKLIIYNSLGEKVKELINNYLPSGKHEINFNASRFASGVYFYQLSVGNFIQTKKMILLR